MYIVYNPTIQMFIAKDNRGHTVPVTEKAKARRFSTKEKANNIISMVGYMNNGRWEVYDENKPLPNPPPEPLAAIEARTQPCKLFEDAGALIALYNARSQIVSEQMSLADKELSDVYHYIEFGNFNAAEGYNAYRILQDTLKRRRLVKNEFEALQRLAPVLTGPLKNALAAPQAKQYTPRVRNELFVKK